MKTVLLTFALSLILLSCSKDENQETDYLTYDSNFELQVGETATFPDLVISLDSVSNDSRCPSDVVCIWEGNAEVYITVSMDNDETVTTLHSNGGEKYPKEALVNGYTIKLNALSPYPESDRIIKPEEYMATLTIYSTDQ